MLILRVDDRLIHTQTVIGWIDFLHLQCIIVANDVAANDPFQIMALKLATPPQIKCQVCPVASIKNALLQMDESTNQLIIVSSLSCALRIIQQLPVIKEINLSNCGHQKNKSSCWKVADTVYLALHEKTLLSKLQQQGVNIIHQPSPWIRSLTLSANDFSHQPSKHDRSKLPVI